MSRPEIKYRPRGAAKQLFECRDPEILIEGPSGTGKTRAVLEKINRVAHKYQSSRHLICRDTRTSMTDTVLQVFEERVMRPEDRDRLVGRRENRSRYVYPNRSEIVIGGLDKVDRIMSAEYDTVSLFEGTEATLNDWETMLTRLRNGAMPYQQGILDCNPSYPSHWINRRANAGLMTRLYSRHGDNPTVTQVYLDRLSRLTGHRRARLLEGRWAGAEGLVYDRFDPAVHVIKRFDIPKEWPRFTAIDFGTVHPAVVLWAATAPDGEVYVYRELHESGRFISSIATEILAIEAESGETIDCRWADHDAQERMILQQHDVYTSPAKKGHPAAEDRVRQRLVMHPVTGLPRLYIFEDALIRRDEAWAGQGLPASLIEEMQALEWASKSDGSPGKERPKDIGNDASDALCYLVGGIEAYQGNLIPVAFA